MLPVFILASLDGCKSASDGGAGSESSGFQQASHENGSATFTETMRGQMTSNSQFFGKIQDLEAEANIPTYNAAFNESNESGPEKGNTFFTLTIDVDTDALKNSTTGSGKIMPFGKDVYGVDAGFLETSLATGSRERLKVVDGDFNLLAKDEKEFRVRRFRYRMKLQSAAGDFFYFYGFKNVRQDQNRVSAIEIWRDTSTLYVSMYKGPDAPFDSFNRDAIPNEFNLIARGRLNIEPKDFARQITTMRGEPFKNYLEKMGALAGFGAYFVENIWKLYVVHDLNSIDRARLDRVIIKNGQAVAPIVYPFDTEDGLHLKLVRYDGSNGQGLPILTVAGLGVNNLIFTHNTSNSNYVQYMVDHGYDVWLIEARFNIDSADYARSGGFTGDVAYKDYQAAIDTILKETGKPKVNIFAHCYGAHTVLQSIVGTQALKFETIGKINAVMLSQASLYADVLPAKLAQIKQLGAVVEQLPKLGVTFLTTNPKLEGYPAAASNVIDTAMRTYNTAALGYKYFSQENINEYNKLTPDAQRANDRIRFIYGELHELRNLSKTMKMDTGLPMIYGPAAISQLVHIQKVVNNGVLSDRFGFEYIKSNDKTRAATFLRSLSMPIGIVHGELNKTWLLSGSQKTIKILDEIHPGVEHTLYPIPGHGHLDSIYGKDAENVTFPHVDEFFKHHNG
jgi:cholesterol oxidase